MEQQQPEMPANVESPKTTIAQGIFPITRFHHFHKDANINYQLNRFLIPGLENLFAEIGQQIENFDDWKRLFFVPKILIKCLLTKNLSVYSTREEKVIMLCGLKFHTALVIFMVSG